MLIFFFFFFFFFFFGGGGGGGKETFYDIFCTENILNLSLYQTITYLTLSV